MKRFPVPPISRWLAFSLALLAGLGGAGILQGATTKSASIHGDTVIRYLDRSIDWYQRITALGLTPVTSQEVVYRDSVQSCARQSLKLAFDFARAQATIIDNQNKQATTTSSADSQAARIQKAAAAADLRVADLKNQLADGYRTAKTPADSARQSKLAAELDLATTQRDVLTQYAQFMANSADNGGISLTDQIDRLWRTVPEIAANPSADATKTPATGSTPEAVQPEAPQPESAGIITLVSEIFSLTRRMDELDRLKEDSGSLKNSCDQLHGPMRDQVMDELRRANSLGATTQDTSDVAKLDADRQALQSLTADFKMTSSASIPLVEQGMLLDSAARSLGNWHDSLKRQYILAAQSLLLHALGTALIVIVLFIVSELWRRATYRYVSDQRRRRQLMLVRRIVIGLIVLMIIVGSVVTEFGSLATFAGLITAGIAVSLQTVILSGVAYFFFIGRYGVRVGDRVTVSGITGDVVEIGLFRIYLMELSGPKTDLQSTGRMIVFSNAVLFQPSAFYKQMPGADYVWHEVALTMSPDTDHALAQKRLMAAVESVFEEYRASIDAQYETANSILHVQLESPRPQVRLRFVSDGVEMVIRYPVDLQRASKIEDQLTRKLLEAIQEEPKLKMVAAGTPRIQSAA